MTDLRLPAWYAEKSFTEFLAHYNDQGSRLLLFVGSGLSRGAGFPSWKELLWEIPKVSSPQLEIQPSQEFEQLTEDRQFAKAGSELLRQFEHAGGGYQQVWRNILDEIFLRGSDDRIKSQAHHLLVRLNWDTIITTNYDTLLEDALGDLGLTFNVTHPFAPGFHRTPTVTGPLVVKLHGSIDDPASEIVLTQEQYHRLYHSRDDFGLRFRETLEVLLRRATLILFVGYGHDDDYLLNLINTLNFSKNSLPPAYALASLPSEHDRAQFQLEAQELDARSGIAVIPYLNDDGTRRELHQFLWYTLNPEGLAQKYGMVRSLRQPTVILLYTGGTIGATSAAPDTGPSSLPEISSRFDPGLELRSKDILETYTRYYYSDSNPAFDLQWEALAPDDQILSENASLAHWNNILRKLGDIFYKYFQGPSLIDAAGSGIQDDRLKGIFEAEAFDYRTEYPGGDLSERQFIDSFLNRYVAGIVILHGTDTLAYTAAALNFTIENLPCPVILTDADQPPDKGSSIEAETQLLESDSWKNIATSLYFLQCFGHRYTEVFVCFADTVNHGPNLRKTPLEMLPVRRATVGRQQIEPFSFRNHALSRQYVFRCIDGVFCNNFYPLYLKKEGAGADGGSHDPWLKRIRKINARVKRFRENPFTGEAVGRPRVHLFAPGVVGLKIHPLLPEIPFEGWGSRDREGGSVRAVVVEGYKSGTYPTKGTSRFAEFLLRLYREGIPVILVARYGIHPTTNPCSTEPIDGVDIPVLPLFGIIMETALPLVAYVVGNVSAETWWSFGEGEEATGRRVELLREQISRFLLGRENIVTLDLGDSTDQSALRARSQELLKAELDSDRERRQMKMDAIARVRFEPSELVQPKEWRSGKQGSYLETELLRGDFLWLLGELIRPLEESGAAPDGFAVLTDMGFDWAYYGVEGFFKDKGWRTDSVIFSARDQTERQTLIEEASSILESVRSALSNRGISQIDHGDTHGVATKLHSEQDSSSVEKFWFEVLVRKGADRLQHEKPYRIQHYSDREAEFFQSLTKGHLLEPRRDLAVLYSELENLSWTQPLNYIDWLVLGAFKGVASAIASYLQFDKLCSGTPEQQEKKARLQEIRESVRMEVLPKDLTCFRLRATYYAHQGRPWRGAHA